MSEHEHESPSQGAPEAEPRAGPRIYVASLSDYNDGILHGAWLAAAVEPDELEAGIQTMLEASPTARRTGQPAEEWVVHDYEGFGLLQVGEYTSLRWLTAVAVGVRHHGLAYAAWAAQVSGEPAELSRFDEVYLGEWESAEAYAEQMLDDLGATSGLEQLDPWLRAYLNLDVDGLARDLQLGGDITFIGRPGGGVWVFDGS